MFIVSDIGGTKTRVAGSRDFNAFGEPIIFDTPQDYRAALDRIVRATENIRHGEQIENVAIGAPGVISRDRRALIHAPNLPRWNGAAIAEDAESAPGTPVILENDTALVGLGEATVGAGKGSAISAYITISTGVNGVRIVDGEIDRAIFGFEIGEQYLGIDATARTFEELVSGRSIRVRLKIKCLKLRLWRCVWRAV